MSDWIPLDRALVPPGSTVLCAVSGGADSMCLLDLLCRLGDVKVVCAHFDHAIRPDSAEDALFVQRYCGERGIPFVCRREDVPAYAREKGLSLETAARERRYAFLREAAERVSADRIATAHTLSDNAETVLFRLARGTGLRGLTGIPRERDGVVRPLLDVSRAEVERYLAARGIPWREDPSNREDGAARNRVRHHVLPALESVHGGAEKNIARSIELLREDEAFLSSLAEDWLRSRGEALPAAELAALPRPVACRVLSRWIGGGLSAEHAAAVLDLCRSGPSALLRLPEGTVRREYGLLLRGEPDGPAFQDTELPEDGTVRAGPFEIRCSAAPAPEEIQNSFNSFAFSCDIIRGILLVTPRREGDRIVLTGRAGERRLKKLFSDAKIPRAARGGIPVIRCGDRVLAVYGFGQAEGTLPAPGTKCRIITIQQIIKEDRA